MQKEESEESESESSEDESESESEDVGQAPPSASRSNATGRGGPLQIPGLTPQQIKKLLDLSAKAESMTPHKDIDKLQQQIAQLMSDKSNSKELARMASSSTPINAAEIKELQRKLIELEKKTQNIAYAPQGSGGGGMNVVTRSVYTPMLVKDDPAFRKYFKLLDMSMPIEQIRAKMETEGVSAALLDTPDAVSPNDPGVRTTLHVRDLSSDTHSRVGSFVVGLAC